MSLTTGVIGCGNISQFYFAGLEKCGVKIKWVCDIVEEKARPLAEKYKANFTSDYKKILSDNEVDFVVVTPVTSAHKQICLDSIAAGKAVICEKTLTNSADDSLEIVLQAQKSETILYTAYMKRFIPAVEKAKELIPSLGKIISTYIRSYQPWGDLWEANPADGFFHTPPKGNSQLRNNYGGGILPCGGSHMLDLVLFLIGRPSKLFASMYIPSDRDYDLQAAALMETGSGKVFFECLAHPLEKIGFLSDGWDEHIKIVGTQGVLDVYSAKWDEVATKASKLSYYDNSTGKSTEYKFEPISPFDKAVAFFSENIKLGVQGNQSRLTGYEVDELIEQIKKSADAGKSIEINWRI